MKRTKDIAKQHFIDCKREIKKKRIQIKEHRNIYLNKDDNKNWKYLKSIF